MQRIGGHIIFIETYILTLSISKLILRMIILHYIDGTEIDSNSLQYLGTHTNE